MIERQRNIIRLNVPHPGADESITIQGQLTAWYAKTGQKVNQGQLLYQITWPGMVIDFNSPHTGLLVSQKILLRGSVKPGNLVAVLQVDSQSTR